MHTYFGILRHALQRSIIDADMARKQRAHGILKDFYFSLKGKCIDFASRAQIKGNFISVPMVYISPPYDIANLPYRRFSDCVSMATTGDDAHSA